MKRLHTFIRLVVSLGTAGVLFALLLNCIVITDAKRHIVLPQDAQTDYDCILVLGCLVYGDRPSAMLRDRLDRAAELYQQGVSDRILVSGDHGRTDYDEVNAMKRYLVAAGVPADNVFMDHAGFSTYESMYRARDVFEVQRVLIVTQPYHLYRAVYDARRLGLDAQGTNAMENSYMYTVYNNVREFLARDKDFVYAIFQPKPTCLGDPIPIQSSGRLTDDQPYI